MHPPSPRPLALFSLIPVSKAALDAVNDPLNADFVSESDCGLVFDIGHRLPKPCGTLATLGRGEVDIFLSSVKIARAQCSFIVNPDTKVIMLHDLSHQQSTKTFGPDCEPFAVDCKRQVVVCDGVNTQLGMGGANRELYTFTLKWHQSLKEIMEQSEVDEEARLLACQLNPRMSRTVDEDATAAQTVLYDTRPQLPPGPKIRYRKLEEPELGRGQFGAVHRALDLDTGKCIAIKELFRPALSNWGKTALERELDTVARLRHPCIVEFLGVQQDGTSNLEICMALKEGTMTSLVNKIIQESPTMEQYDKMITTIGKTVLPQMLSALDFLACHRVVHRDLKPDNILYDTTGEYRYNFFLADFGLCNKSNLADTAQTGSRLFMAPEVFWGTGSQEKADVWSLFVTMLWVLNADDFRDTSRRFRIYKQAFEAVVHAADNSANVHSFREMAIRESGLRASAAQMLRKIGPSSALTTPQEDITPLVLYSDANPISHAQTRALMPEPSPFASSPALMPEPSPVASYGPAPRRVMAPASSAFAAIGPDAQTPAFMPEPSPFASSPALMPEPSPVASYGPAPRRVMAPTSSAVTATSSTPAPPPLAPPSDPPAAAPRRSARIRNRKK
ncbi:CAMK kinase [Ilyonectria robusta]